MLKISMTFLELLTPGYCLLGVDLTQLHTVEAALRLCGIDFDVPTLLLSECVMTYMTHRWYSISCSPYYVVNFFPSSFYFA